MGTTNADKLLRATLSYIFHFNTALYSIASRAEDKVYVCAVFLCVQSRCVLTISSDHYSVFVAFAALPLEYYGCRWGPNRHRYLLTHIFSVEETESVRGWSLVCNNCNTATILNFPSVRALFRKAKGTWKICWEISYGNL